MCILTERLVSLKTEGASVNWKLLKALLLMLVSQCVMAQGGGGRLYDPEPPADSAYLRVVVAGAGVAADVVVDGRVRVKGLPAQEASEYLVLQEGNHVVALHAQGKAQVLASKSLDIAKGKSSTLVFASLKPDTVTTLLEDKGNTNKLKATLAAYHLAPKLGVVDIVTADGANKVFSGLAVGSVSALQVNPISIELQAMVGKSAAKVKLEMAQGGTYSAMLFEDAAGKPRLKVFPSRVERYTGAQ